MNKTEEKIVGTNEVIQIMQLNKSLISGKEKTAVLHTSVTLNHDPTYYMYSTHFFKHFKELVLPKDAKLKVKYDIAAGKMTLSSDKLLKNVFISSSKEYLKLSDNYFDLVPGHQIQVTVKNKGGLKEFKDSLRFMSYLQSYQ